jgi:hypothetical protein
MDHAAGVRRVAYDAGFIDVFPVRQRTACKVLHHMGET